MRQETHGWFEWGAGLSRAERDAVKERIALLALSSVLAFAVLLVGGLLLWDKVILAQRAVLAVDGHTVSLRQYADSLAYKQNVLLAELDQAQALAGQGGDPTQPNPLAQMAQQQMQQIQSQLSSLPSQHLEELIDDFIIRDEAKKRGITVTPDELDTELKTVIGYQDPNATPVPDPTAVPTPNPSLESDAAALPAPTVDPAVAATAPPTATASARARRADTFQARYRDYLKISAGTDAIVRSDAEMQLLRKKLNDQLSASIPNHQEEVHVQHILVPDETAAQTVIQRLNNGDSFDDLAAELSLDTSNKDKGGDLGWFPRGVMVSDFEDAAFKLQPGQVSAPVKTQFGYHILHEIERDPSHEIDPQLYESLKSGALTKWLEGETKNHQIARYFDASKQEWALNNARKPSAPSRAA